MKALNQAGIARDAGTAAKMFGAGYVQSEEIARSRMEREAIEAQIKKANAETDQIELNNGVFHERVRMQSEQHVKDLLVADFGMDMSRANLLIRQMEQALQQKRYELDRQKYELERSVFRFEQSKWTEQESMRFIQRENERLRGTGLRLDSQRKIIEMEGEILENSRKAFDNELNRAVGRRSGQSTPFFIDIWTKNIWESTNRREMGSYDPGNIFSGAWLDAGSAPTVIIRGDR